MGYLQTGTGSKLFFCSRETSKLMKKSVLKLLFSERFLSIQDINLSLGTDKRSNIYLLDHLRQIMSGKGSPLATHLSCPSGSPTGQVTLYSSSTRGLNIHSKSQILKRDFFIIRVDVRLLRLALFNLCMLELSYRCQTLYGDS